MTGTYEIETVAPQAAGLCPDALSRLDARIAADIGAGGYLGASVLVGRGGKIAHRALIGSAAPGRAVAQDDIFLMMSITKSFTASLILRAIDEGRFTLDSRVADFIPPFAAGGKQNVTVRQLLTHTGGTFAGLMPPPPLTPFDLGDLDKNVAAIALQPAAFIPGERCAYNSFAGYAVLGQLLVVTDPKKRGYREIMHEDLFTPLGMKDTSIGLAIDEPRRVPVSYIGADPAASKAFETLMNGKMDEAAEHPAGGAFGTADDIFRFADTLRRKGEGRDGWLLSPALFDYACRNHTGDLGNDSWDFYRAAHQLPPFPANFSLLGGYVRGEGHFLTGLGLTASPRAFCAIGGGSTMWMVDPDRDLTFVFLSAGFIEGLAHMKRLCQLADLALAAVRD